MDQPSLADILEQRGHRLARVFLVRADDPGWSTLDPARAVRGPQRPAFLVMHPAGDVSNRASTLVERKTGETHAPIAHAAEDEPTVECLALLGRDGHESPLPLLQSVPH